MSNDNICKIVRREALDKTAFQRDEVQKEFRREPVVYIYRREEQDLIFREVLPCST